MMTGDEALKITNKWEMHGFVYAGSVSQSWMRDHTEPPDEIPDNDCPNCGYWDTTTILYDKPEESSSDHCAIYYCPECDLFWLDEDNPANF